MQLVMLEQRLLYAVARLLHVEILLKPLRSMVQPYEDRAPNAPATADALEAQTESG
jgi:hypothetical protein